MKVLVSVAVSADGYIDDASQRRLILSSEEDRAAVKSLRAGFDAILVGAETVRRDNPSLRSGNKDLVKVTVTGSGDLDPGSKFFTEGSAEKIVIAGKGVPQPKIAVLEKVATVVRAEKIDAGTIIDILETRGIKKLFVEGGTGILTMFFTGGAVNYLRLAVAPFFVGDSEASRFVGDGKFPFCKNNRMTLFSTEMLGDMAVMNYGLYSYRDRELLERAIELSHLSPKSGTAYSVGAVIVTASGKVFEGYSRETASDNHAEEEAILKAERAGESLSGATIYSSMEPCSRRGSKPVSCSELIIGHKIKRVVYALGEPANFVTCEGYSLLKNAGVEVLVINNLAAKAAVANAHLIKS